MRILQDIRWRQFYWSVGNVLHSKRLDYKLRSKSCLGQYFFYKDIVLSMWNYKESSGTVFRLRGMYSQSKCRGECFKWHLKVP